MKKRVCDKLRDAMPHRCTDEIARETALEQLRAELDAVIARNRP